ncbi:MAG: hypothetical protein V1887_02010 [Candidatus Aenigmatarchaeota archaeon]
MAYVLGVSTGTFGIARSADPETRHEYIGIPKKALWSITKGVNFAQVDMESVSEFIEPDLEKQIAALERIGIDVGIHGEAKEYTSVMPYLDSALFEEWHRSHDRLIKSLTGAGKDIHAKYFLLHSSASTSWQTLWHEFQPTNLADIWGRRLDKFLEDNPDVQEWAISSERVMEVAGHRTTIMPKIEDQKKEAFENYVERWKQGHEGKELSSDELSKMKKEAEEATVEQFKRILEKFVTTSEQTYGSERVAYYCIGYWMQEGRRCPVQLREIWKSICGRGNVSDHKWAEAAGGNNWVPAVTCAYTWGHFNPDKCPSWPSDLKRPEDPKPILEKYNLLFVLETPVAGAGEEELLRLAKPTHIYALVKNMGSPNVGVAWDSEHQLCGGIDPMKEADSLPDGAGKMVRVIHVGYPAVLGPAHVPIPLGSEAQEYIYRMLWKLRKKGFKDGWIIFERGAGQEPVKESVISLRKIIEFLDKEIVPEKLPDEFYGMEKGGVRLTRQEVAIKDHAMDPLKGLLVIPEEEYGFLSTAAAAKGKLEEWKKAELK